jgi:DNA-binding transcriptional MerR regulator
VAPSRGQRPEELGPDTPIPDKLYFKIGEVAKLVGVQAHVLRYWQSEIPAIRPSKSTSNQRRYRFKDVEIFREIRRLLYQERYTLAGARKRVLSREAPATPEPAGPTDVAAVLERLTAPGPVPAPSRAAALGGSFAVPPPAASAATGAGAEPARAQPGLPPSPRAPVAHGRARPADPTSALDDDTVQRLRRGLKDLIRLAGEEP